MKKIIQLFTLLICSVAMAQQVNDYQYIIVPTKFAFSKDVNPFGLSTLTKALLQKHTFVAFLDTEVIPDEILRYNCNKLYADVIEENTITTTKLTIVFKDCKGNIVYQSAQGKSRTKDWRVGYNEALRDAAKSLDLMHYKYNGNNGNVDATPEKIQPTVQTPANAARGTMLFAQPIANGFQLVDEMPKIVLRIYKTNSPTIYLAEKDSQRGVLWQQNGQWYYDCYKDGVLVSEPLQIKF